MSVTNIYRCPECKITLRFDFDHTNLSQCTACQCIIYKDPKDNLSWVRDKKIIDTAAIIQPGTTGKFRDVEFRIAGRFRTWADDSILNFWTLIFNNGGFGMLAEGYGFYRVVVPFNKSQGRKPGSSPNSDNPNPENRNSGDGNSGDRSSEGRNPGIYSKLFSRAADEDAPNLKLDRLRQGKSPKGQKSNADRQIITRTVTKADKWDMEGEVFIPLNEPVFLIAETESITESEAKSKTRLKTESKTTLKTASETGAENESGTDQIILSFGRDDKESVSFIGEYVDVEELNLQNLRSFKQQEYALTCEKCSKPVEIKRFPYTKSVVCQHCGAFYGLDSTYRFKLKPRQKPDLAEISRIPLHSKGIINNIEYEVTGFARKEEINIYKSKWREYVLFNPTHGYAFLSEFDGHWIFLQQKIDYPAHPGIASSIDWENEPYQLYNRYKSDVIEAAGEFPYNIFDARGTEIREFISPPEMWSFEKQEDDSFTWYHGKHIYASEVSKAFPQASMPSVSGIGAIQPTGYASNYQLLLFALFGLMIMSGIHLFISNTKAEREVYTETFRFDSLHRFGAVSPEFVFEKSGATVELNVLGQLNNSWMEVAATLVNKTTGTEYAVQQGIEYYSGYSDGESWNEGSLSGSAYFNAIPPGRYVLQLDGSRESTTASFQDCRVALIYDVSSARNLWFCYLLFFVVLLIKFAQVYYYEHRRWRNSPFSNYD